VRYSIPVLHSILLSVKTLGAEFATLENVFKSCDYIIVSLALNQDTEKIIGRELINFMKPTAIIVNISRGGEWFYRFLRHYRLDSLDLQCWLSVCLGLIDQDYLVEALQNNRIGGAALDVTVPEPLPPEHPLLHLDNVCEYDCGLRKMAWRKRKSLFVISDLIQMSRNLLHFSLF